MALICMGLFSCEKRHVDDNLYDSSVYIINNGLQKVTLFDVEAKNRTYKINTYCAGFHGGNPNVRLVYNQPGVLDAFNEENGTKYELLPENCYKLDSRHKIMEDSKVAFEVTFDCDKIAALSEVEDYSDLAKYVIPYTVVSETDGIQNAFVEDIKNIFITLEMHMMSFELVVPKTNEIEFDSENCTIRYKLKTVIENNFALTSEYTMAFEIEGAQTGTKLAEGDYTVTASADAFTKGVSEIDVDVTIPMSKLYGTDDLFFNMKAEFNGDAAGYPVLGENTHEFVLEPYPLYDRSLIRRTNDQAEMKEICNSAAYADRTPFQLLDGDLNSKWEASYGTNAVYVNTTQTPPYWIIFDYPDVVTFKAFSFYRRTDQHTRDLERGYIEVSDDRLNWTKATDYDFGSSTSSGPLYVILDEPVSGKYLRLWCTGGNRGSNIGFTELYMYVKAY